MKKDWAASVRTRLLAIAKSQGVDFNQILVRFALERFLYRLGQSADGHRFLLKGALLFTLWYDMPHRSTRDVDHPSRNRCPGTARIRPSVSARIRKHCPVRYADRASKPR